MVKSIVDGGIHMAEKITDFTNHEQVRLWINGNEKKDAYIQAAQIIYSDKFGQRVIQAETRKYNTGDCLSAWTENGVKYFTYNPDMKNAPVKLRRVKKDVYVLINLAFYGPLANEPFIDIDAAGVKTALDKTYADVAYEGIAREWGNNTFLADRFDHFGDDPLIEWHCEINRLPEDSPVPHLRVRIQEKGQPMCLYNVLWSIDGKNANNPVSDIRLCAFFGQHVWQEAFRNLAAHEIGHSLGLGDAYDGLTQKGASLTDKEAIEEVPLNEIMRSNWNNTEVTSNTIEMILEAFKTNKLQRYDPRFHSKAIQSY